MTHWHVHRSAITSDAGDSSYTDDFDQVRTLIDQTDPVVYRRITINEPPLCDGEHADHWINLDKADKDEKSDSGD